MTRHLRKKHPQNNLKNQTAKSSTFLEHIRELRQRFFFIFAAVAVGALGAYAIEDKITSFLLAPARGEQFMYTTPGGGLEFLFRICLYSGIIVAIPVIIFQIIKFLSPLLEEQTTRFAFIFSGISALAAGIGIAFGYIVGLPAALKFLLQEFSSSQITANITIQSYLSFVLSYLIGTALLLQLPLILLFINRIKPLSPKKLLSYERWVILGAFVLGAVLNPTPSVIDFMFFSLPIVITYQVGIVLIWITNRKQTARLPENIMTLHENDRTKREKREQVAQRSTPLLLPVHAAVQPSRVAAARVTPIAKNTITAPLRAPHAAARKQAVKSAVPSVASPITPVTVGRPRTAQRNTGEFIPRRNFQFQGLDSRSNLA